MGVKKIFVTVAYILLLASYSLCGDADWQRSIREGENAYVKMKEVWLGSKDKYLNRLLAPLMTGKRLYTLDGKSSSDQVRLMCPGADPSVEVFVQPSATKDLSFITVKYDSNFDGKEDSVLTVPGPVSGICADGFVRCRAGTWDECKFYRWVFTSSLTYMEVPETALTNCYCINSSCTSLPYTSYARQVISTIGSGVVSALVRANPRFAIGGGEVDPSGMYIRYFAQNARECVFENAGRLLGYGFRDADEAYSYNMDLMARADEEIARQSADPESLYNLVYNMPTPSGERKTCTIIRSVYFDSSSCTVKNSFVDGCVSLENDPKCRLEKEKRCDVNGNCVITYASFSPTGLSLAPTCKTIVDKAKAIQCLIECRGNLGTTDGGCPLNPSKPGSVCYNGHVVGYALQGDTVILTLEYRTFHGTCGKEASYPVCGTAHISLVYPSQDNDPCIVIKKGGTVYFKHCCHDCDSGYSFSGDVKTNGIERVYAKIDDSGACDVITSFTFQVYLKLRKDVEKVCYPWWRIERTYYCERSDLDIDLRRPAHIDSTIREASFGAEYEDLIKNPRSGRWSVLPGQRVKSELSDIQGKCIPACKVRIWVDPAQAKEDKTSKDYRYVSGHYRYLYRLCEGNSCPVRPGEEVVQGCTCVNDFNRWISVNEVLRISGIDEICSTGKKRH